MLWNALIPESWNALIPDAWYGWECSGMLWLGMLRSPIPCLLRHRRAVRAARPHWPVANVIPSCGQAGYAPQLSSACNLQGALCLKRACLNDVGLHYTCFGKSALMHSASCLAWNALECDGIPEWFAMLWLPWLQNSCENAHCFFKGVDFSGECNRMHPARECRQYSYISGMLRHALDCFWFWVVGSVGRHVRVSQNSVECFGQVMLPLGVAIYKAITPIFGMPRLECQALECQDSGHQVTKTPQEPMLAWTLHAGPTKPCGTS